MLALNDFGVNATEVTMWASTGVGWRLKLAEEMNQVAKTTRGSIERLRIA